MTKQQAVKRLVKLGVYNIEPHGRYCVKAVVPGYKVGIYDPKDLVAVLERELEAGRYNPPGR